MSKVNMETLSARKAHELIEANIQNQSRNLEGPATEKQRQLIRLLVRSGASTAIPLERWNNLTKQEASDIISAVPDDKRKEICARETARTPETPARATRGRGIE